MATQPIDTERLAELHAEIAALRGRVLEANEVVVGMQTERTQLRERLERLNVILDGIVGDASGPDEWSDYEVDAEFIDPAKDYIAKRDATTTTAADEP